jgi:hypothetical protein
MCLFSWFPVGLEFQQTEKGCGPFELPVNVLRNSVKRFRELNSILVIENLIKCSIDEHAAAIALT